MATSPGHEASSFAAAAVSRGLSQRQAAATNDIERVIDAAYRLIDRNGVVDFSVRELLAEADLSIQRFYSYFASKDEFVIVLLENGQQRLLAYLEHRIARHTEPRARIQACMEGFLAQAEDLSAAARTRPFVVHQARLCAQRPELRQRLGSGLDELVVREVQAARPANGSRDSDSRANAEWVRLLVSAVVEGHILEGTKPSAKEKRSLLAFCFRALQV